MQILPKFVMAALAVGATGPALALGICVEGSYPPFSETRDDGTLVGFDIDIAAALCAQMEEDCFLVQSKWSRIIPDLVAGECDAIIASMSDTPERRNQIDFSARYYKSPVRFVGRQDAGLSDDPEALAGKAIGAQRGTINQTFVQVHYPDSRLMLYGNQEHVLMDLTFGRLDAVLGEAAQLEGGFLQTSAGEGFVFVGPGHFDPEIQGEGAAIGLRKSDPELARPLHRRHQCDPRRWNL